MLQCFCTVRQRVDAGGLCLYGEGSCFGNLAFSSAILNFFLEEACCSKKPTCKSLTRTTA